MVFDHLTSDATTENLKTMERNGISTANAIASSAWNTLSSQVFICYLLIHHIGPVEFRLDFSLVATVLVCLTVSDIVFYYSHRLLHRALPQMHLMHCCKRSSLSTNGFFHPVDMSLEFGGPSIAIIFITLYVFKDTFALLVSLVAVTSWYFFSHDEYIKMAYYHHQHVDSNYTLYVSTRRHDPQEKMRKAILH
eukprot:TRINITY_DN6382_c0_g1_i2.p1 TRINITY_DN6382_c0_g1~~TRINITY_DN6382_c0_g1_i2.p1  ORF type:complete len:193 (-),score=4.57 TRINITY_DN6382_c0_g1_i2:81-659(-)